MRLKVRLAAGAATVAVTGFAFTANALAAAATATAADAATAAATATTVGEVLVTAERRAENVQTVPVAVTAIGGQQLQSQGVAGFQELGTAVPSLRFGSGVTGGQNVIT